jgi:hypothetical protein
VIFLATASWVARITGMSHWHPPMYSVFWASSSCLLYSLNLLFPYSFKTIFGGFHYASYTYICNILWSFSPPSTYHLLFHSPFHASQIPLWLLSLHVRPRFCIWAKTCNIWLFELGLFHSIWWSPVHSFSRKRHNFIVLYAE